MSISINPQMNSSISFSKQDRRPSQCPQCQVQEKKNSNDKILKPAVLLSAIAGVLLVVSSIAQHQGINLFKGNKLPNLLKPNTWKLAKPKYEWYDIIKIGTGSIVGGLATGIALDPDNQKAKIREGFQQILGNIMIPVGLTTLGSKLADKYLNKDTIKVPQLKSKTKSALKLNEMIRGLPGGIATLGFLAVGIVSGNWVANKLSHKLLNAPDKRHIELGDFSGHMDDLCLAAVLVAPNNKFSQIGWKLIPAALLVAGFQTGTKKQHCHCSNINSSPAR